VNRDVMNQKIGDALDHIPRGPHGSAQNHFRMVYKADFQHQLSKDPDTLPAAALLEAAADMRRRDPTFEPIYDRDYFKVQ
jgi:hypothetical protein